MNAPTLPILRYARTSDNVAIAYTITGDGPALVCLPPAPFSNLVMQRYAPSVAHAYDVLARHLRVIQYDARGTGSSQRDVKDFGLESMLRDLEAVLAQAGDEKFALFGYFFSSQTAIAYAARHPERVTQVIIFGGAIYARETMNAPFIESLLGLLDLDWEMVVESLAHAWLGWSVGEEGRLIAEAFRTTTTPANARAIVQAAAVTDVVAEVGRVTAPTLVLHRHDERQVPLEVSQRLAEALPDGRLLRLEGSTAGLFMEDPDADVDVLLDFLVPGATLQREDRISTSLEGDRSAFGRDGGVFISCSERQKEALARPFKTLLAENSLHGYIVSDEPRPEGTWTPEEKVDAYLELSDAVVVFATADLEAGDDRYTRPNIGDEIARARSKPHLRNRVCVLKEHGVTLPSNINPAYEALDLAHVSESFQRAMAQLHAWGLGNDRHTRPSTAMENRA